MANLTIHVPPAHDFINMKVGDNLYIDAKIDVTFCCDIGNNFIPSISNLQLPKGSNNGPYEAVTAGSVKYNTSGEGEPCNPDPPSPMLAPKSAGRVQITNQ